MAASISNLAEQVRKARERKAVTRADIVRLLGIDEGDIEKLESGEKLPGRDAVESVCRYLGVGEKHWRPLLSTQSAKRKKFEETLEELVGAALTLDHLDNAAAHAADRILDELMGGSATATQTLALLNRLLTFYGVESMSRPFFEYYLTPRAFSSEQRLTEAVRRYQVDAIRLFSSFGEAYAALNSAPDLESHRRVLEPHPDDEFRARRPWSAINLIDEERLPDLGYISASAIRKERDERSALSQFLIDVAGKIEQSGPAALAEVSQEKLRRMDSLLRKFSSTIPHGFLSPLFAPDADALRREADRLGPKEERDLSRMERTQAEALENLANYLTADYMDVYVATSMRTNADFVSVNRFVTSLFAHPDVAPLNLRFFNPTQSWIEDRVAKGLVEALMLRRSFVTIYMAQKDDTFGKDSEASVALGQGKPVAVYVPRLYAPSLNIDSAELGLMSRNDLAALVEREGDREIDATFDREALHSRLLTIRLSRASREDLAAIAKAHWADFDLYGEAERLPDESERRMFRKWLDSVVKGGQPLALPQSLVEPFQSMLVAIAMRFERRAEMFREVHPLALQVILSTGILNGILVVRSIDSCADLLVAVITNSLQLELVRDANNYKVVETKTRSIVRVISRNPLLASAFRAHYKR